MPLLKYAVANPGHYVEFKEKDGDTYDTLKSEIPGMLGVVTVGELDFWHDDEFLLKGQPVPTILIKRSTTLDRITDEDILLCGTVLLASHNEEGDTISLTDEARHTIRQFQLCKVGNHRVKILYAYK